ncbi:hypothetical protein ACIBBD_35850 [Streptomyces sp. NPDC051315]|uniref:hypothetical protein n=1 Tax=Streptomyces sp. NPDC051315 TaxID=3365650 RepID=UPI0037A4A819
MAAPGQTDEEGHRTPDESCDLSVVGINSNYGDTAKLSDVTIVGGSSEKITVCECFEGNSSGDEPTELGSGPDGTHCVYDSSDVTYQ